MCTANLGPTPGKWPGGVEVGGSIMTITVGEEVRGGTLRTSASSTPLPAIAATMIDTLAPSPAVPLRRVTSITGGNRLVDHPEESTRVMENNVVLGGTPTRTLGSNNIKKKLLLRRHVGETYPAILRGRRRRTKLSRVNIKNLLQS